jgi:RNA polymerase sigma factor (sigma-70 family)
MIELCSQVFQLPIRPLLGLLQKNGDLFELAAKMVTEFVGLRWIRARILIARYWHMESSELNSHLSSIQTQWTKLLRAHHEAADERVAAQKELLLRYYGAVYRYLLGTLRDPTAAEELTQEFAVRFLRGDFHRADPARGRFRDFMKTAVRRLAIDYWRKKEKAPTPLPEHASQLLDGNVVEADAMDQPFLEKWREELLARTWEALVVFQEQSGQPYHTVMRWKAEQPKVHAAQLAARLGAEIGKPVTEVRIRQVLHRARKKFTEFLVDEVARSIETTDSEKVEQELIELNLLNYCQSALARRDQNP